MGDRLTHVSLCSGIGGIDLAAEWAGFQSVAVCEIDEFCRRVLAKNFPNAIQFDDVRTLSEAALRERGIGRPTLISAGFPCQDVSRANRLWTGVDGARSGLVFDILRLLEEVKPSWFLFENSPALLDRGFDRISGELRSQGYTVVEPVVLGCDDVGLPQERDRLYCVARLDKVGSGSMLEPQFQNHVRQNQARHLSESEQRWHHLVLRADANAFDLVRDGRTVAGGHIVHRGTDGVPNRLDRLRALGNAVVPQQVYPILQWIANYEREVRSVA